MSTLAIKPKNDTDTVEFQTHSGNTAIKVQGTDLNLYNLASDTDLSSVHKYGNRYAFAYYQHAGNIIMGAADTGKVFGNTMTAYSKDNFTTIYDKAPTGYGIVTDDEAVKYKIPKNGLYEITAEFYIQNDGTGGPGGDPGVCSFTMYLFSGNVDNLHTTNNTITRIGSGLADAWSSLRWQRKFTQTIYFTKNTIFGWRVYNSGASSRWQLYYFRGHLVSEVTI